MCVVPLLLVQEMSDKGETAEQQEEVPQTTTPEADEPAEEGDKQAPLMEETGEAENGAPQLGDKRSRSKEQEEETQEEAETPKKSKEDDTNGPNDAAGDDAEKSEEAPPTSKKVEGETEDAPKEVATAEA